MKDQLRNILFQYVFTEYEINYKGITQLKRRMNILMNKYNLTMYVITSSKTELYILTILIPTIKGLPNQCVENAEHVLVINIRKSIQTIMNTIDDPTLIKELIHILSEPDESKTNPTPTLYLISFMTCIMIYYILLRMIKIMTHELKSNVESYY